MPVLDISDDAITTGSDPAIRDISLDAAVMDISTDVAIMDITNG